MVVSFKDDDKVVFYSNDGTGVFSEEEIIGTMNDGPHLLRYFDVNNDNDLDLLVFNEENKQLILYTNLHILTSTSELFEEGLSVFPNPSSGNFTLECKGCDSYEVYDLNGKLLSIKSIKFSSSMGLKREEIVLPKLNSGIYILKVIGENGAKATRFLVD